METTLYNISQVLGITIIHSLWQGMLVYFALRIVFAGAPGLSSVKKYNLGVFAMATVSVLFIYTLVSEISSFNWAGFTPAHLNPLLPDLTLATVTHATRDYYGRLAGYMPYICALYVAGLFGHLLKLGWNWRKIQLIKRSVICAEQMQQFINKFSKKLDITKKIQLKFSELVDVPCVIGYFKPLILLPVSLSTHLSACEVESILLHELAHIKRHDYLINLMQQSIAVILFFNPFSRLINRIIGQERENSCDDLVIEKTGKPLIYAQALLKLETARANNLQLALAVTGKKFYLLKRIERIMKTQKQTGNMRHLLIAVLLLAGGLCSIAWLNPGYAKTSVNKGVKCITSNKTTAASIADSTTYLLGSDTGKHKSKLTKGKPVAKKHTVVKKSLKTEEDDDSDTTGFFSGREWKTQQEQWKKMADNMKKQFNSPEWKARQEQWKKMGEDMKKQFDSPEWKTQQEQWKNQALAMQKQFDSPEWKARQEQWKKMGEDMKKQFDSPEWKARQEQWKKQADQIKKQYDSPEWKQQQEQWKKMGEDMKKQFDSPEWKARQEQWKKQADQIKKQYDSPEWKQQQEQWKKMGEDMKKQFDSPDWKKQQEQWKRQADQIKRQFDNPEWKKQMRDMQKQFDNPEWQKQMREIQKQSREMGKQFMRGWTDSTKNRKWMLKDTMGGVHIYRPAEKDTVRE